MAGHDDSSFLFSICRDPDFRARAVQRTGGDNVDSDELSVCALSIVLDDDRDPPLPSFDLSSESEQFSLLRGCREVDFVQDLSPEGHEDIGMGGHNRLRTLCCFQRVSLFLL